MVTVAPKKWLLNEKHLQIGALILTYLGLNTSLNLFNKVSATPVGLLFPFIL